MSSGLSHPAKENRYLDAFLPQLGTINVPISEAQVLDTTIGHVFANSTPSIFNLDRRQPEYLPPDLEIFFLS